MRLYFEPGDPGFIRVLTRIDSPRGYVRFLCNLYQAAGEPIVWKISDIHANGNFLRRLEQPISERRVREIVGDELVDQLRARIFSELL